MTFSEMISFPLLHPAEATAYWPHQPASYLESTGHRSWVCHPSVGWENLVWNSAAHNGSG
jgi:hypothetical protein